MYSKIIVIGNLGKDSELKVTNTGRSVCTTSLAVNDKNGDQQHTTWYNLNIWGKLAEQVHPYLKKGKQIYAEGRLRIEEWQNRNDQTRISLFIDVQNLRLLGGPHAQDYDEENANSEEVIEKQYGEIEDDNIPFDEDVPF